MRAAFRGTSAMRNAIGRRGSRAAENAVNRVEPSPPEEARVDAVHGRQSGRRGVLRESHAEARATGPPLHWAMHGQAPAGAGCRGRSQRQHQELHVPVLRPNTYACGEHGSARMTALTVADCRSDWHDERGEKRLVDVQ